MGTEIMVNTKIELAKRILSIQKINLTKKLQKRLIKSKNIKRKQGEKIGYWLK